MAEKKLTRQQARTLAERLRINFNKDYHELRSTDVNLLLELRKRTNYRKPAGASGSLGRYFYRYLQRSK